MQVEGDALLVRVMDEMVDALGIEGRRPALDAMHHVSLGQQKLGEVGAILPGHAGDEGHLARGHHCPTPTAGRDGPTEYTSQASAPGSDPIASASPKHTENSSAFSGAMP